MCNKRSNKTTYIDCKPHHIIHKASGVLMVGCGVVVATEDSAGVEALWM